MRDVGQRFLIALAGLAVLVMVVGYAFIAGQVAAPIGSDLGTVEPPDGASASAVLLDDGRPAFIVAGAGEPMVVDARAPHQPGAPGRLVSWCEIAGSGFFLDLMDGATYDADGARRSGPPNQGLVRYPVRRVDDGQRIVVGSDGRNAGGAAGERVALDCPTRTWVVHRPRESEIFDPTVAIAEEPPGWIWLEGRLTSVAGQVRLCDGLEGTCETAAVVSGIDPALVVEPGPTGRFLGRVRDDALADLQHVPDPGGSP